MRLAGQGRPLLIAEGWTNALGWSSFLNLSAERKSQCYRRHAKPLTMAIIACDIQPGDAFGQACDR